MKKLLFLVFLLLPALLTAQDKPVSQGFTRLGTATTAYTGVPLLSGTLGAFDLSIANRDTDTDTLKVVFNKADTSSANIDMAGGRGRVLFVIAGEIHNVARVSSDTLWVKSSSSTPYTITGVRR